MVDTTTNFDYNSLIKIIFFIIQELVKQNKGKDKDARGLKKTEIYIYILKGGPPIGLY